MKKKMLCRVCITLFIIGYTSLSACSFQDSRTDKNMNFPLTTAASDNIDEQNLTSKGKVSLAYFNTVITMDLYDDFSKPEAIIKFDNTWDEVNKIMEEVESDISVSIEDSDIARFNALSYGESIAISEHTANIILNTKEMYKLTGRAFDPTVYPIVDLWGFTPRFRKHDYKPIMQYDRPRDGGFALPPEEKYIEGFLNLVNFDGIVLTGNSQSGYMLTKNIPPVKIDGIVYEAQLDIGGIGKGYVSELVKELLIEKGYEYGYFSCGRSSMVILKSYAKSAVQDKSHAFHLGITKPRNGSNLEARSFITVKVKDVGLSTSGDYDNCFISESIVYSHIISPFTGFPINTGSGQSQTQMGISTVSVIGDDAMCDDVLSTALCILPLEDVLELMNNELNTKKIFIVLYHNQYDYCEIVTNVQPEDFIIDDSAYHMASRLDDDGNVMYTGEFVISIFNK